MEILGQLSVEINTQLLVTLPESPARAQVIEGAVETFAAFVHRLNVRSTSPHG
jgi:hypothetical protein